MPLRLRLLLLISAAIVVLAFLGVPEARTLVTRLHLPASWPELRDPLLRAVFWAWSWWSEHPLAYVLGAPILLFVLMLGGGEK